MKTILTISMLLLVLGLYGQKTKEVKDEKPASFVASYYSINGTNPGAKLSFEKPLRLVTKTKTTSKDKNKLIASELYFSINLGYVYSKEISHTFILSGGIGYRRIGNKGLVIGTELGLLTAKSYNAGETYEVSEDDEVTKVPAAGNSFNGVYLNLEFGYKVNDHWMLSGKPGGFIRGNHYETTIPEATFEFAVKYTL